MSESAEKYLRVKMEKIGIIGYGNMGQAIGQRIKDQYAVCVFDQDKNKTSALKNITVAASSVDLVKQSEVIVLAIKPQDFDSLLNEIKSLIQGKLIISIAAGITTQYLRNRLGEELRVIRVMPNMPAQIGQGISVLFKDKNATQQDRDLADHLLSCVGKVLFVSNEKMINAATAVSGSGPAFFCYYINEKVNLNLKQKEFIQELIDAAVGIGFNQQQAKMLVEETVNGTTSILEKKNLSCGELIKMVASKGGTTQAGLEVLQSGGSLKEAINSAWKRAEELGKRS